MQKLIRGLHQFQANVFSSQKELFQRLAIGQNPDALFITCSDSRINPNLITQTGPGDLFIIRNAGNIIPSYGAVQGGEAGTIEFAVAGLGVKDIIVCGHSHCGAMKGLLQREKLAESMPALAAFLGHAEATRRIVRDNYKELQGAALETVTVEENVLVQIENLRTHPAVASALARGQINLHGWVYKIETGEIFCFDPEQSQFVLLADAPRALPNGPRLTNITPI
ncbi:carbonic anhydrase [Polyangium aurulentum]|uniref:carbonic anhydrase n=1 Tax=Polyangium aurulentum TaxID=2567896 RepID=UPI0010ADCD2F|nr:carbonic anhydrase [Polyangium aurulentum]UQA55604.1 carbonic anhydrase [Polyangium aurulentum]